MGMGTFLTLRFARWAVAGLVGLSALAWVVEQSGPQWGEAVVHVAEEDVEVVVGHSVFRIGPRDFDPIVVELRPGRHTLTLRRAGQTLFEQEFRIEGGRGTVLTAYDPGRYRDGPGPRAPSPGGRAPGAAPSGPSPGGRRPPGCAPASGEGPGRRQ